MENAEAVNYRATMTQQALGDEVRTWQVVEAQVVLCLEDLTDGRKQQEWGITSDAQYRATMDIGYDVTIGDCLVITVVDGVNPGTVGQQLLVLDRHHDTRQDAQIVALQETNDGPS